MSADEYLFYYRGRVALLSLLRAAGVGPGDPVAMQGFTCVAVANAVKYLGARPIYIDVDPRSYTMTVSTLQEGLAREGLRRVPVVIVQNTFGHPPEIDPIMSWAKDADAIVIEDSAHGFGSLYKGEPSGDRAHAAFFSSQWSKPFTTGLGGFAKVNGVEIRTRLERHHATLPVPPKLSTAMQAVLVGAHQMVLRPAVYWPLIRMYRRMSATGLIPSSSSGAELNDVRMPEEFERRMSKSMERVAKRRIESGIKSTAHRQWAASRIDEILVGFGLPLAHRSPDILHGFLRYPVEVIDRKALLHRARSAQLELGDWFVSPLHPIIDDLSRWNYKNGSCPNAERIAARIVNIPTHEHVKEPYFDRLCEVLDRAIVFGEVGVLE
jgi:perosamine synthetase